MGLVTYTTRAERRQHVQVASSPSKQWTIVGRSKHSTNNARQSRVPCSWNPRWSSGTRYPCQRKHRKSLGPRCARVGSTKPNVRGKFSTAYRDRVTGRSRNTDQCSIQQDTDSLGHDDTERFSEQFIHSVDRIRGSLRWTSRFENRSSSFKGKVLRSYVCPIPLVAIVHGTIYATTPACTRSSFVIPRNSIRWTKVSRFIDSRTRWWSVGGDRSWRSTKEVILLRAVERNWHRVLARHYEKGHLEQSEERSVARRGASRRASLCATRAELAQALPTDRPARKFAYATLRAVASAPRSPRDSTPFGFYRPSRSPIGNRSLGIVWGKLDREANRSRSEISFRSIFDLFRVGYHSKEQMLLGWAR